MKKYSRQRELIINSLKNRIDHPTADMLYLDLKKEMPELGIATVYRNLVELCEEGAIIKIKSKIGPDRYDGNTLPHIHFQCECCNNVYDIFLSESQLSKLNNEIKKFAETIDAKLTESNLEIVGLCKKCKQGKQEKN